MRIKNSLLQYILTSFLLILFLYLLSCVMISGPVFYKDGKRYGWIDEQWGGKWWNYYERGFSYSQGSYWEYAEKDFKEAIKQRSKDQRRVRTYGLHILDDYFPHRELGIIYYNQNRLEEAIYELELSLAQYESSKAKYFLNLARRALLQKTGLDKDSPKLFISKPLSGTYTNQSKIFIQGEALDDFFVGAIIINQKRLPIELSNKNITFQSEVELKRGENNILIEALDLVDNKTTFEIVVWCDQEAPIIYIENFQKGTTEHEFVLKGFISDACQIAHFTLNDQLVEFNKASIPGEFSLKLHLVDLKQSIKFEASDILGNQTSGEFYAADLIERVDNVDLTVYPMLAFLGNNLKGMLFAAKSDDIKSARVDEPVILLKSLDDHLTVDFEEFYLEGEVRDKNGVHSIKVNNIPLINRTAKVVFFNHLVPLKIGENEIIIEAENLSGTAIEKIIYITRKANPVYDVGSRLNIAIIPFEYKGDHKAFKDLIYDTVMQKFYDQRRFNLVEREKIEKVFDKKKDLRNDIMELGKLVSAEAVIVGRAYFFENSLEVIARMIDVETTVVITSQEVYGQIDSYKDIGPLLEGLGLKFKQACPVIEGHVIGKDSHSVQINIGENDRILRHMKVNYFRKGEKKTLSGSDDSIESKWIKLGEGRIESVYKSFSDTLVLSLKQGTDIEVNDLVITK